MELVPRCSYDVIDPWQSYIANVAKHFIRQPFFSLHTLSKSDRKKCERKSKYLSCQCHAFTWVVLENSRVKECLGLCIVIDAGLLLRIQFVIHLSLTLPTNLILRAALCLTLAFCTPTIQFSKLHFTITILYRSLAWEDSIKFTWASICIYYWIRVYSN